MELIINLFVSCLFAGIDVYLIELYMRNVFKLKDGKNPKIYYLIEFILMFFVNIDIYQNTLIKIITSIPILILSLHKYKCTWLNSMKIISFCLTIIPLERIFLTTFFEFIFFTNLSSGLLHFNVLFLILIKFIQAYFEYIIICYIQNKVTGKHLNILYFKVISIFLSIYLCITILFTNDYLFYFPSVGRTFTFVIIVYNIALIAFDKLQTKHMQLVIETKAFDQIMKTQMKEVANVQEKMDDVRKFKHNYMSDYIVAFRHLQNQDPQAVSDMIESVVEDIKKIEFNDHLGNIGVDSIIDAKIFEMRKFDIRYEENIKDFAIGSIDPNKLALLLYLAFDNAIEACKDIEGDKLIRFDVKCQSNHLVIHLMNSIVPGSQPDFTKSSKLTDIENHGYGMRSIREVVKLYDGDLQINVNHDYVDLRFILKL